LVKCVGFYNFGKKDEATLKSRVTSFCRIDYVDGNIENKKAPETLAVEGAFSS
jgi:hypothetical protein